jgi:hypothetical protein
MQSTKETIEYVNFLKESTRANYNSIGSISCPLMGVEVFFNSIGFIHLLYKPDGTAGTRVRLSIN